MTPSRPQIPIIGKIRLVIAHKPNHPTSPAFQLYGYSTVTDSDFYSLIPHNNKIRYISIFKGQQILLLLFFVCFFPWLWNSPEHFRVSWLLWQQRFISDNLSLTSEQIFLNFYLQFKWICNACEIILMCFTHVLSGVIFLDSQLSYFNMTTLVFHKKKKSAFLLLPFPLFYFLNEAGAHKTMVPQVLLFFSFTCWTDPNCFRNLTTLHFVLIKL